MEEGNVMVENEIKKDVWGAINTLRFNTKIAENAERADRIARRIEKRRRR